MALLSALLSPFYLAAAWLRKGPGIATHLRCAGTGLKLMLQRPGKLHARWIYYPLESTRYLEIPFVCQQAGEFQAWLDVSSPRQLAALLLARRPHTSSVLLNPDPDDLAETREMVDLLGYECTTLPDTIESLNTTRRFDLVTCVSVLEHIPGDAGALTNLWRMVKEGGRLILTVPVSADGGTQYIDRDPYGVNQPTANGFFFQRFYSNQQLRELQSITGAPRIVEVWGERERGWLQANFEHKRRNPQYPVWREPYEMATHWQQFKTIDELPGEGVYGAVFIK